MRVKATALLLLVTAIAAVAGMRTHPQDPNTPDAKARAKMVGTTPPTLNVGNWVNTDGKTLSLEGLKGKVVVLDFFTFW